MRRPPPRPKDRSLTPENASESATHGATDSPTQGATDSKATTAERILAAAEELFCATGFEGVSVRDIADRAGTQKALVFYHFASKEELFGAVLARYYESHRRALEGAMSAGGDVRQRMHGLVDAYLDFMAENARYALLVQAQLSHPATHPLVEKSFGPLYHFIERVLVEVAPREGPAAARELFVTFSGAVISWCTYAPLLSRVWGGDLLSPPLLEERRAHLHWLVNLMLDDLAREAKRAEKPAARRRSKSS